MSASNDQPGPDDTPHTGRGRAAERPLEIPREGWRDVLLRVKDALGTDNVSLVSAGVAFYGLLAIFPALAALVSVYALTLDPSTIATQLDAIRPFVPVEAFAIIERQLDKVVESSGAALGLGFFVGLFLSIWSANKGMKAIVSGLNIVYGEHERRGFVALNLRTLGLTFGAIVLIVVALGVVVVIPLALDLLGLGAVGDWIILIVRWPLIALVVALALAVLYRFGPDRDAPQWQWVSWGSIAATVLWALGSLGFSFYVSNFGSYNETYGSMGAVVILLTWFYLSAFIALAGAELNAELEHQTRRDSTVGPDAPIGERDAYVADTVGKVPD